MHWVLQENLWSEKQYDTLLEILKRFDIPYSIHKVIPFVGELIPDINPPNPCIVFGSYSMRHLANKRGWNPGCFDLADIDFNVQRDHWGEEMLNVDGIVSTFFEATPPDGDFFIRPTTDTKYFTGTVMNADEFYDWKKKMMTLDNDTTDDLCIHAKTKVLIAKPKKIYQEYRHWIVDGKLVTSSMYKLGDRVCYKPDSEIDRDVINYAKRFVEQWEYIRRDEYWQPHDAYVLDTCVTPDGNKIVEINTINSAGFYSADILKLVMALEYYGNN